MQRKRQTQPTYSTAGNDDFVCIQISNLFFILLYEWSKQ